ncbi:MAG TPA: hypothetical protein VG246_12965 [Acidimicrobiales bacterium]|jgi:hypothetical protein|nr:hypothetical protein [Acidimicrobiales bacterium]
MSKRHYVEVDPISHTHSAGEIVGFDGRDLVGPPGFDGVEGTPGVDGRNGADSTVPGPAGPPGKDGADGTNGRDGVDGTPGRDAIVPSNVVTMEKPNGVLFGVFEEGDVYRLVSGVAFVAFTGGHGEFVLPEGTKGVASFHGTLLGSQASVGLAPVVSASSLTLLANVNELLSVSYLALIW